LYKSPAATCSPFDCENCYSDDAAGRFEGHNMTILGAVLFGLLTLFLFVRFSFAWLVRKPRVK